MKTLNLTEAIEFNQALQEQLLSDDPSEVKNASEGLSDFTRRKVREGGISRALVTYHSVNYSDLDRQYHTDTPMLVMDFAPDARVAVSVGYGALPPNRFFKGERYPVRFDRLVTRRMTFDVGLLGTWKMDARQVISDILVKTLLAEEDGKFIATVNSILGGPDQVVEGTGVEQWVTTGLPLDRTGWVQGKALLRRTPNHLNTAAVLMNTVTALELEKWGRDMTGGDLSEEVLRNGFTMKRFGDVNLALTIKRNLVPDGAVYHFAEQKFMGTWAELEPTTMVIKRDWVLLEYFAAECIGGTFANVASCGRIDYGGVIGSDTPLLT